MAVIGNGSRVRGWAGSNTDMPRLAQAPSQSQVAGLGGSLNVVHADGAGEGQQPGHAPDNVGRARTHRSSGLDNKMRSVFGT